MPQTKERHTDYMRDYRKHKKSGAIEEAKRLAVNIARLLQKKAQLQHKLKEIREQWMETLEITRSICFIVSRTDLTDQEKVARISAIPIPNDLVPHLRKQLEEVTA